MGLRLESRDARRCVSTPLGSGTFRTGSALHDATEERGRVLHPQAGTGCRRPECHRGSPRRGGPPQIAEYTVSVSRPPERGRWRPPRRNGLSSTCGHEGGDCASDSSGRGTPTSARTAPTGCLRTPWRLDLLVPHSGGHFFAPRPGAQGLSGFTDVRRRSQRPEMKDACALSETAFGLYASVGQRWGSHTSVR